MTPASARIGATLRKGRLHYKVGDTEEVFEAGDAFYLPPGHIPVQNEPRSEFVQFSPTHELRETQTVCEQAWKRCNAPDRGALSLLGRVGPGRPYARAIRKWNPFCSR
jgi:hypothetical protein